MHRIGLAIAVVTLGAPTAQAQHRVLTNARDRGPGHVDDGGPPAVACAEAPNAGSRGNGAT